MQESQALYGQHHSLGCVGKPREQEPLREGEQAALFHSFCFIPTHVPAK